MEKTLMGILTVILMVAGCASAQSAAPTTSVDPVDVASPETIIAAAYDSIPDRQEKRQIGIGCAGFSIRSALVDSDNLLARGNFQDSDSDGVFQAPMKPLGILTAVCKVPELHGPKVAPKILALMLPDAAQIL